MITQEYIDKILENESLEPVEQLFANLTLIFETYFKNQIACGEVDSCPVCGTKI